MGAQVVEVSTRGSGAALMERIHAAIGEFVIMGDADDSYDFSRLDPLLERLRAGNDLVMGNRFRGGIAPGAMREHASTPLPQLSGRAIVLSRSVNSLFLRQLASGSGRALNGRGHPVPAREFRAARNRSDRDDSQTEATVEVDERAVVTRPLGLGELELCAPVSGSETSSRVDLILSPTLVLPNGDGRAASGRLSEVEFVPGASE